MYGNFLLKYAFKGSGFFFYVHKNMADLTTFSVKYEQ